MLPMAVGAIFSQSHYILHIMTVHALKTEIGKSQKELYYKSLHQHQTELILNYQ